MNIVSKSLKHNGAFLALDFTFRTESDRDEFVGMFPKFCGIKKGNTWTEGDVFPRAYVRISLVPLATVHGLKNEAGPHRSEPRPDGDARP